MSALEPAARWPAFVELAARGSMQPERYLKEEVVRELGAERLGELAAFAFVGGGDDLLCRAVTGSGLDTLLADIPLVRWSDDHAYLHDLWAELLTDRLDDTERARIGALGADHFTALGDHERAIDLHHRTGRPDRVATSIGNAIRSGVDGGLTERQVRRWLDLLPPGFDDDPAHLLARGVVERELDPTGERSLELLDRAATAYQRRDDPEMELTALLQLGYVIRVRGERQSLDQAVERLRRLADRFPPAVPFLAFARSWAAVMAMDKQRQLDEIWPIRHVELAPVWATARDHLIANALFGLGRADEAVQHAPDLGALDIPVPGALVTRAQSLWFAGRPLEAKTAVRGDDARHGARDRMIAAAWSGLMAAWAGDLAAAREHRDRAVSAAGSLPASVTAVQLIGLDLVLQLSAGDDAGASATLEFVLELAPVGTAPTDGTFFTFVALPYVLAPDTRPHWDAKAAGPTIARRRVIAAAFVAARAGDHRDLAEVDWLDPAFIATALPVRWATEFALLAIRSGETAGGRRLLTWLCEHWRQPAGDALIAWTADDALGSIAATELAAIPMPPVRSIAVSVLGTNELRVDGEASADPDWRRERVRALLTWLIIHRHGTRHRIAADLWLDVDAHRAARSLRTTLNYLHRLVEPGRTPGSATWFVRSDGPDVRLHPSLDVDLWRFDALRDDAEAAERIGRTRAALPLLIEATECSRGDIAPDLDAPWLDLERIRTQSRFVRAGCRAAELLIATRRPDEAIRIAQRVISTDPFHAASYDALATAYDHVGDHTSARSIRARAAARRAELD
ncbi:MAG: BTAD domain-containing putative transcriptional regulator [Actinomycetota bacterium]